jgi:hypothetical protein
MKRISRRNVITGLSIGGLGALGVRYNSKTALAAEGWSVTDPSVVENTTGSLSSLKIKESGFSVGSFKLSGSGSGEHDVTFTIRAKLSGDSSYEDVSTGTFTVQGGKTVNTISWNENPFPANILAATSINANDFKSSIAGDTETVIVDLQIEFAVENVTQTTSQSFSVSVKNTGAEIIDTFNDGTADGWSDPGYRDDQTDLVAVTDNPYEGSHCAEIVDGSGTHNFRYRSGAFPEGNRYSFWVYKVDAERGVIHFGRNSDNEGYQIALRGNNTRMYTLGPNGFSRIGYSSTSTPSGEWLEVIIDYRYTSTDTIEVIINDESGTEITRLQTTNTTYSGSKLGLGSYNGTTRHDYITNLTP